MKFVSTLSVAALAAGALVAAPSPSLGATGDLPITHLSDLVVDQDSAKVFISGGSIVLADLSGAVTGAVPGVSDAGRLTLSSDGAKLVALTGAGFTVIDPTTATVDKTIAPGTNVCPGAIAPASGKVFFSYRPCDQQGNGNLGAVDLTSGVVTTGLLGTGTTYGGDGELTGVSGGSVLGASTFENLYVIDTTGGTSPTATIRSENTASRGLIALNPSGTELYAKEFFGSLVGYDLDTLEVLHSYDAYTGHVESVAVRNDGYLAVGAADQSAPDIGFYQPGSSKPDRWVDFGGPTPSGNSANLQPRGLAFGASKLYAVTASATHTNFRLRVVAPGPDTKLAVTSDKYVYNLGSTATVAVDLQSQTADRTVSLWSSTNGGTRKLIKTGTVGASTHKLVVKVPKMTRNTRFYGTFAGDDSHPAGEAKRDVKVPAVVKLSSSSTSMSGIYHKLKASPAPLISGVVSPSNTGQSMRSSAAIYSGGAWHTVVTGTYKTTSTSRFGIKLINFKRGQKVRVSARYFGTQNAQSATAYYYVLLV